MRDYFGYRGRGRQGKAQAAKRSLKAGDVVLSSEPFAIVVEQQWRAIYCHHCMKHSRDCILKPCTGECGFCFFCCDDCQWKSNAEVHAKECPLLRRFRARHKGDAPCDYARLLARIILRLKDGGDLFEEKYTAKRGRKYKDLMNHYKDIKEDVGRMEDVRRTMRILKDYMVPEDVPNESEFIGLYGRSMVNRFCISDQQNVPMGSAVYLAASIFDHSCMPNAVPAFVGRTLYIRTLCDVEELNFDKVRISYIDCINSKELRQKDLLENWYFTCECDLCNDSDRIFHENFIMCPSPNCDTKVQVPDRYNKAEMGETTCKALPGEDSSATFKRTLKAAKMEYSFANVTVNPFASTDALMSYLYSDSQRYKPAPDSDYTEESSSDEEPRESDDRSNKSSDSLDVVSKNGAEVPNGTSHGSEESVILSNGDLDVIDEEKSHHKAKVLESEINPRSHSDADSGLEKSNGFHDTTNGSDSNAAGMVFNGPHKSFNGIEITETEKTVRQKKGNGDKVKIKRKMSSTKKSLSRKLSESTLSMNGYSDTSESELSSSSPSGLRRKAKTLSQTGKNSNGMVSNGVASNAVECNGTASDGMGSDGRGSNGKGSNSMCESDAMSELEQELSINDGKVEQKKTAKVKKLVKRAKKSEPSDLQCVGCGQFLDRHALREYRSAISFTMQRLKDMKEDNINFTVILDVLERQGDIVPATNVWRVRLLDFAFNAAFQGGAFMLALKYGNENLPGMRYHYKESHPSLGLFYVKMAKANLSLKLFKEGMEFIDLAKKILVIACGPDHPFITREIADIESLADEDIDFMFERRQRELEKAGVKVTKADVNFHDEEFWKREKDFNSKVEEDSKYFGAKGYTYY